MAGKPIALITGAGRGIGLAIGRAFAAAEYRVVLCARSSNQIDDAAGQMRKDGGEAFAFQLDVTAEKSVEQTFAAVEKQLGPIDILVNNAGTAKSAPLRKTSLELWNELMLVNLTGTFLCTRRALNGMLEKGWGRVINIASTAGKIGGAYISAYSASKHGVIGFTRSVALEVAGKGVTVNAICPGYVDTPLTQQTVQRMVEQTGKTQQEIVAYIKECNPQHRMIEPQEVAAVALFLCTEEASGINGQALNIDGGG